MGQWIFKLLGDAYWVERLYSLLWYLLFLRVAYCFKKRIEGPEGQSPYWLPLSFLSIHAIVWSYQHNMLENLVLPAALFSHGIYLHSLNFVCYQFGLCLPLVLYGIVIHSPHHH